MTDLFVTDHREITGRSQGDQALFEAVYVSSSHVPAPLGQEGLGCGLVGTRAPCDRIEFFLCQV